jgi:NAD(P)-dependent dehydrogenase (short-subunit alcohol dehydrogenase family)
MPRPTDFVVPDQTGRTALVTGANSGLGFQTSLRLARAGATVLMACRNPDKAADALARVEAQVPGAAVSLVALDLASLASVRAAATEVLAGRDRLDLLVNNAGVMAIPRTRTADGFEMQFGTNHLGHFALTGLLVDLVTSTPASRIVNVASSAHKMGRMRFDDLMGERRYEKWSAYGQSKLANLLFTAELQRRLTAVRAPTIAVAAHPGWSATHLQTSGRGVTGGPMLKLTELGNRLFAQSDEMGALPTLHAATSPDVIAGGYYGPGGIFELQGLPTQVVPTRRARDVADARELWRRSEELTGVTFDALDAAVGM